MTLSARLTWVTTPDAGTPGHRSRVGREHQYRYLGMGAPDRCSVGPRTGVALGSGIAIENHAPRMPAFDRTEDLLMVGDGHVLVSSIIEQLADEGAERWLIFDQQYGWSAGLILCDRWNRSRSHDASADSPAALWAMVRVEPRGVMTAPS